MTDARSENSLRVGVASAALVLAYLLGCSAADAGESAAGLGDDGISGAGGSFTGGTTSSPAGGSAGTATTGGTTATGGTGAVPPPPEEELESAFEVPVATDRFVWTANPTSGKVALIDAETYEVRLAEAGFRPTTVAGLPAGENGEEGALVLNEGSSDATVLRVAEDGTLSHETLRTHHGANAVVVTPDGRWAVVWTDAKKLDEATLDPTEGLQDVTVLDLGPELTSTVLSVGYRPSRVVFDEAETRALIVTEPGLSVLELGDNPRVSALVELTDDPVESPAARDVSVTPDGSLALVRVDGKTSLGLGDVTSGDRTSVELGDFVTDLDLSSDGKSAYAIVGSALVVVPVPPGRTPPSQFRGASVADVISRSVSLSPDGSLALLYSNAESNPYLTVLTSADGWESFVGRALDLKAPVRAVFAAPDSLHAIALQDTAPGSTKHGAFSLISAQNDRAPKIIGTDAPPIAVAFSPDGADAVIATREVTSSKYGVYLVHLENLEETLIALPSPPLAAGIVPRANSAFVAQAHPEGRITFVHLDDGSYKTLTGFELAGRVVE